MSEGTLRMAAPAKLNLTLAVLGGPRPDGYHELRGVFARLTLADELTVMPGGTERIAAPSGTSPDVADSVRIARGPIPVEGPVDIVARASAALRGWARRSLPPLDFEVRKRIPIAAGLGGGSSDAAAALRLAAEAWHLGVGEAELAAVARDLGADVPFFFSALPLALVAGRGERVEALPSGAAAGAGVLLVTGGRKPSTAEVFRVHDETLAARAPRHEALGNTDRLVRLMRAGGTRRDFVALARALREANDLYPAAATVTPGLAALRRTVEETLGEPALLSGAGPTLFVLYASAAEARRAANRLAGQLPAGTDGSPVRMIATAITSR